MITGRNLEQAQLKKLSQLIDDDRSTHSIDQPIIAYIASKMQ
jgi:hypothetical protein